jgi:Plasmid pRiA4b ORF-3-like protein
MMQVIEKTFLQQDEPWEAIDNPSLPFGDLQPIFQTYFPAWQNSLMVIPHEFRAGLHIFKVSLGDIWRRMALSGDLTLDRLSSCILDSVDFDADHLDMFQYRNQNGRSIEIYHPHSADLPHTDEVAIGELPLTEGASMTYIFDFGDRWKFEVKLEKIQADDGRSDYAELLEIHGEAPQQYDRW